MRVATCSLPVSFRAALLGAAFFSFTDPMNEFETQAYESIRTALSTIAPATRDDIYALSFHLFDVGGDPRLPCLQLGYNTLAQVAASTPSASGADEARWNFAFWLQNELAFIAEPGSTSARQFEDLVKARGLWFTDEDDAADFDRCTRLGEEITASFADACVHVAQALHVGGVIEGVFGRPVPVIVHGLDYHEGVARRTERANPPGLAADFVDWIARM